MWCLIEVFVKSKYCRGGFWEGVCNVVVYGVIFGFSDEIVGGLSGLYFVW